MNDLEAFDPAMRRFAGVRGADADPLPAQVAAARETSEVAGSFGNAAVS